MLDLASLAQPRVLAAPEPPALFVTLGLREPASAGVALAKLAEVFDPAVGVLGIGAPLAAALGASVPQLRPLPPVTGPGISWPSTQGALWIALYGGDPGTLLHAGRALLDVLGDTFAVEETVSAYQHREGRDLSGFEDGTANPQGADALACALVDAGEGLAGSTYAAVQRWVHDLGALARMPRAAREDTIGRRLSDNEEIADAPESAHVKRTAQEEAGFLLRRSMPWGSLDGAGLAFLAYAKSPDVFERHARRMVGAEDGVVDAVYAFTRPVSGGAYWCPPVRRGALDLRALGL